VESVDGAGITITDDNYGSNVARRVRISRGSPAWPDNFLHFADAGPAPIGEGSFVRGPDGRIYRIAGAAPIHVASWDGFGGPQPYVDVSQAQLDGMRRVPADGTFIHSTATGRVYRIAGGAPIWVSSWNAYGGVAQPSVGIDQWAIDNADNPYSRLRARPIDGTFVRSTGTGRVYRIVGGAPTWVHAWEPFGGSQPYVDLDQWAFDNTGDPHAHMNSLPADGTFVVSAQTGRVYRIAGGAPIYVSTWAAFGGPQGVTAIDQWALDHPEDPHAHIRRYPADGWFVSSTATGRVYRIAGGAPIWVSSWDAVGGPQPTVSVDQWAFDNIDDPHAGLRRYPADGTFVHSTATGRAYRIAGGAPVWITSWAPWGQAQATVGVDQWAFNSLGDEHAHMRAVPLDGTRLRGLPSSGLFEVVSGRRRATTDGSGAVAVNDHSLDIFRMWQAPTRLVAAAVDGPGLVGTAHTCVPADWDDESSVTVSWRRNGAPITGADHRTYVPTPNDDGSTLSCAETAANIAGTTTHESAGVTITTPRGTGDESQVGVTVNFGARFTNDAAVVIRAIAPVGTNSVTLSNDGGFRAGREFPLRSDGLYRWTLEWDGPERLPKTVYVRFNRRSQTFSDDIILDTSAPVVRTAAVAPGALAAIRSRRRARTWRLRVSASDRTSGVSQIQVGSSRTTSRRSASRFRTRMSVRGVRRPRWVRVGDRAGNWSSWRRVNRARR